MFQVSWSMTEDLSLAKTLVDVFQASCEKFANRTCFIMRPKYRTVHWTYRDFYNYSVGMALFLRKRGLKKGDRALLLAPNSPWWQAAFWGCQLAGVIPVPLMVQSTPDFVGKVAKQTGAKILLKASSVKKPRSLSSESFDIDVLLSVKKHSNILQNVRMFFDRIREDDIVEILYTSGTTAEPKGVALSHKNIVSNLKSILPLISINAEDKTLSILPLSHIFEQIVELRGLAEGAATIYLSYISSTAILEALKEYRVTLMAVVPEFLRLFWRKIETEAGRGARAPIFRLLFLFSAILPVVCRKFLFLPLHRKLGGKLRLIVTGGAALDPDLGKKWQNLGFTLLQGYGLTETSPILTVTPYGSVNIKSVGKAIPGVELKISKDGEVLAKGPNVFSGYYKNPRKTKKAFEDGWFKTGDMGYFDKEGFLYLTGRKKFMILTESGQNVYPEDLERELNRERGVEDSCVVVLEKGDGRNEIHAVLLGRIPDPEKIIGLVNKRLASFQRIQSWSLWPFSDFPRTVTRKVKRPEVLAYLTKGAMSKETDISGKDISPLSDILSEISGVPATKVKADTKIAGELKLDSLGRIELVARIEEKFGVEIDEAKITAETRVKDLEKLIQEQPTKKVRYRLRRWPRSSLVKTLRPVFQKAVLFPLLLFFAKIEVRGTENLQNLSLPCIFMANHLSDLDAPSVIKALPDNIRKSLAVAAATDVLYERYMPFQPIVAFFINTYPFQRKGQVRSALLYMGKLLDEGWSILVFPEGQISPKGNLLPLKSGAGVLAVDMGVSIVPVKITGTNKILPLHWRLPYPRKLRGRIEVVFGKPLDFSRSKTGKTGYEKARKDIEATIREL